MNRCAMPGIVLNRPDTSRGRLERRHLLQACRLKVTLVAEEIINNALQNFAGFVEHRGVLRRSDSPKRRDAVACAERNQAKLLFVDRTPLSGKPPFEILGAPVELQSELRQAGIDRDLLT
jgi:hypothetical protein